MQHISIKGNRSYYDVIVIGSGIAGLSFTLELIKQRPNINVALICKTSLKESNSHRAQGGIASVFHSQDSYQQHIEDTMSAGQNQNNPLVAKSIIENGPKIIKILHDHGVLFDKTHGNEYDLVREGGHSHPRILHFKDHTGAHIIETFINLLKRSPQVSVFEFHTAINLIQANSNMTKQGANRVLGAYVLEEKSSLIHTFFAKCVVLATGGAGKVYRYTSNSDIATGDGIAMAYRVGASIGNLEFYQFHPTLLYHNEDNNFLISEVVRGEGARLLLPKTLSRFMQNYSSKMELATRDIVARAIFNEIERSPDNFVWLDIRHKSVEFLRHRFPMIFARLLNLGIDMSKDLIPVVPAAHYLCGGIVTDVFGQTDVDALLAIGETAFTGFHGANRLASNSLLEAVVTATNAVVACLKWLDIPSGCQDFIPDWNSNSVVDLRRASQINAHWRGLRGEMTSYAGIIRTADGLNDLLKLIAARKEMVEEYYWKYSITRDLVELRNIILIAELIIRCALQRNESRGCHFREDYPHKLTEKFDTILRGCITSQTAASVSFTHAEREK